MRRIVLAGAIVCCGASGLVIDCERVTDHSLLVTWEPEQARRTTRDAEWESATPTGRTHEVRIISGAGRNGQGAGRIVGKSSENQARGGFIRSVNLALAPGDYTYSVWYRTAEPEEGTPESGTARVLADCYLGDARRYHSLLSRDLEPSVDWREVTGTFTLPEDVRLARILLYQVGVGSVWYDQATLQRSGSPVNLLGGSGALGGRESWRVFFRPKGRDAWERSGKTILERFHNVIFLNPDTEYELRVEKISDRGEVLDASQVLTVRTQAHHEPRTWQGLSLGKGIASGTPTAMYPCIESVDGRLFLGETRAGAVWLHELDADFKVLWSRQWVAPHLVNGHPCYQGQTQSARLGERLFVSWKRTHDGDAPHARQCVASYNIRTGEIGDPFVIEPDADGESTWNGGIAEWKGQLWISYCRRFRENGATRLVVTVRQLDYDARTLGPACEFAEQPTATPYTPFLSVFGDDLVVCFSEMSYTDGRQPLWLVRFDGTRFHGLLTVNAAGHNRYAKGVQLGDRLLLVWKYGTPYPPETYGRYMFHDIGLALIDPLQGTVEITSLIDTIKYNSSPDITLHKGGVMVVYNTFEHLYGNPLDPAELYGTFFCPLERLAP